MAAKSGMPIHETYEKALDDARLAIVPDAVPIKSRDYTKRRLTKEPVLVLSPSHIVEQWMARAADYFLPQITAKEASDPQDFVQLLSWSEGRYYTMISFPLEQSPLQRHLHRRGYTTRTRAPGLRIL
ncbi:hypothetical protein HDV64DRAFT_33667 [Trichoderma sp. TUCIM 5745]